MNFLVEIPIFCKIHGINKASIYKHSKTLDTIIKKHEDKLYIDTKEYDKVWSNYRKKLEICQGYYYKWIEDGLPVIHLSRKLHKITGRRPNVWTGFFDNFLFRNRRATFLPQKSKMLDEFYQFIADQKGSQ